MNIVEPSYQILTDLNSIREQLKLIEHAGRKCYKSEDRITDDSAGPFVEKICNVNKHESVIEHSTLSVAFVCDRGVSHELVRHRLCAFSQESTRYCNYTKGKFDGEITVICPPFGPNDAIAHSYWCSAMYSCEAMYRAMISVGVSPQIARSVLPNSLKTEIVVTANFREWRHIFKMRCAPTAHPQMRELMIPLCTELSKVLPEIFQCPEPL